MQRWLKRNPQEAAGFAIAVGLVIANLGNFRNQLAQMEQTRAIAQANNMQIQSLQLSEQRREELAQIANARYDQGCEVVLNSRDPRFYKALVPNAPVIDGNVAHLYRGVKKLPVSAYLPPDMLVCDVFGNTAVIKQLNGLPVASEFATTTDQSRIKAAMERTKAKKVGGQL